MSAQNGFDTQLTLAGPLRRPRQMLADQEYGGHASIHDDSMAEKLGFRAGPIEGPTHFSLFPPLLEHIWGREWYGCTTIQLAKPPRRSYKPGLHRSNRGDLHDYCIFADRALASDAHAGRLSGPLRAVFVSIDRD